jgi:hypothetical protein
LSAILFDYQIKPSKPNQTKQNNRTRQMATEHYDEYRYSVEDSDDECEFDDSYSVEDMYAYTEFDYPAETRDYDSGEDIYRDTPYRARREQCNAPILRNRERTNVVNSSLKIAEQQLVSECAELLKGLFGVLPADCVEMFRYEPPMASIRARAKKNEDTACNEFISRNIKRNNEASARCTREAIVEDDGSNGAEVVQIAPKK